MGRKIVRQWLLRIRLTPYSGYKIVVDPGIDLLDWYQMLSLQTRGHFNLETKDRRPEPVWRTSGWYH